MSLFVEDMILYRENPKDSTKKTIIPNTKFSKLTGYKINIQKSLVFLYTNNALSEKKNKTIPFIVAPKTIKYLGINLERLIHWKL